MTLSKKPTTLRQTPASIPKSTSIPSPKISAAAHAPSSPHSPAPAMTTADIPTLLETLTASLASTLTSLPSASESAQIAPPRNGISLLDVKNDVLLSYLHNLAFLSLLRLRSAPVRGSPAVDDLVRLRLLLERAVRPLEAKLKYQIDKVVVAANNAERTVDAEDGKDGGEEDEQTESDSGDESVSASDGEEEEEEEGESAARKKALLSAAASAPTDLAHRPNLSSLLRSAGKPASAPGDDEKAKNGLYRPPRIAATSMPTTVGREKKPERAPPRAHLLDDFVSDELSSAPLPLPSIGTTIVDAGRGGHKSARDRRQEFERQEFEEANLVRLPKSSKKEARAGRRMGAMHQQDRFGGEDWRGFAGDLDRITARVGKTGRGEKALEKSRKRQSGGEGEGRNIGEHYEGRKGMATKRRKF